MDTPASIEKIGQDQDVIPYTESQEGTSDELPKRDHWAYLKRYFTSREGWIGDYVPFPPLNHPPALPLTQPSGLCIPHNPQHLASKPQIQRLRSPFLRPQRRDPHPVDSFIGSATRPNNDRLHRLPAPRHRRRSIQLRCHSHTIPRLRRIYHNRYRDRTPSNPRSYFQNTLLHWDRFIICRRTNIRYPPHSIQLHINAVQSQDLPNGGRWDAASVSGCVGCDSGDDVVYGLDSDRDEYGSAEEAEQDLS
jgi:hypothetical protein